MNLDCDIAVIGAGFSGSLLSMALRRMGRRVVLIDRTQHPRFAIGESTTPLTNLLLEDFAKAFELPEVASLAKWGSWQRQHPELACGLKRGFTFYHHRMGERFRDDAQHQSQLLVAASPSEPLADTHWYRPDFDHFLFQKAEALGTQCLLNTRVSGLVSSSEGCTLGLEQEGSSIALTARWVIDASGARGCLFRLLGLSEKPLPGLPRTQSLFAHFRGVKSTQSLEEFQSNLTPPYPPDSAATHHLFEGGWIWVLPFNNGITSAGVALMPELAHHLNLSVGPAAWDRLLHRLPSVKRQFESSEAVTPFVHQSLMPFSCSPIAGNSWSLLPSAAGFVDPLFSTGFPLTLLGLHRVASICREHWGQEIFRAEMEAYSDSVTQDLEHASRFIGACYAQLGNPRRFAAMAKLYFASVIYAETARRLGRPSLAGDGFLMRGHANYRDAMTGCLEISRTASTEALESAVASAIAPIDLGALNDPRWKNWIRVDFDALRQARGKVGATDEEIEALIQRAMQGG